MFKVKPLGTRQGLVFRAKVGKAGECVSSWDSVIGVFISCQAHKDSQVHAPRLAAAYGCSHLLSFYFQIQKKNHWLNLDNQCAVLLHIPRMSIELLAGYPEPFLRHRGPERVVGIFPFLMSGPQCRSHALCFPHTLETWLRVRSSFKALHGNVFVCITHGSAGVRQVGLKGDVSSP